MIACLDTNIVIWLLQAKLQQEPSKMAVKANIFLEEMEKAGHEIIIPAPVVTEVLLGITEDRQFDVLQAFHRNFLIAPYDAKAAAIDAALRESNKCIVANFDSARTVVAVALAFKADVIFSDDSAVRAAAGDAIRVSQLPEITVQDEIPFSEHDAKSDGEDDVLTRIELMNIYP